MEKLCRGSRLPPYMAYPRYLLDIDMGDTAKLVYVVLLDRGRLSMRSKKWMNDQGHVYVYYPITDLGKKLGVSDMTIKRALKDLEAHGMIHRVRQGMGKANQIYVCIPDAGYNNNDTMDGTGVLGQTERKWSGNNKVRNGNYELNEYLEDGGLSL